MFEMGRRRRQPKMKIGPKGIYWEEKRERKKLPKDVRDQVWDRYIGATKTTGKCYCCRWRPITYRDFEVGHNKSKFEGGRDHINNLRPICKGCNRSMGTKSIEWYKNKYYGKKKPKKRAVKKKKKRQTYDQFAIKPIKIKPIKWY